MVGDPAKLSDHARSSLLSPEAELFVSISAFEIVVKHRKGKLELPLAPTEWFQQALAGYGIVELPVNSRIASLSPLLAAPHNDPCDRMIIATAQLLNMAVVTPDHLIHSSQDVLAVW